MYKTSVKKRSYYIVFILLFISLCSHANEKILPHALITTVKTSEKYPWMMAILNTHANPNIGRFLCSATLVSPQWLLTATQCVTPEYNYYIYSKSQKKSATPWGIASSAEHHIVETTETYTNENEYNIYSKDGNIAMLKLKNPIFNITPVNLPNSSAINYNQRLKTLLWKDMNLFHDPIKTKLHKGTFSKKACGISYNVDSVIFCKSDALIKNKIYPSNSGSPLLINNDGNGFDTQIGIGSNLVYGYNGRHLNSISQRFTNIYSYHWFIYTYTRFFSGGKYRLSRFVPNKPNVYRSLDGVHILGDNKTKYLNVTVNSFIPFNSEHNLIIYDENGNILKVYKGHNYEEFTTSGRYIKVAIGGKKDLSEFNDDFYVNVKPTETTNKVINADKNNNGYLSHNTHHDQQEQEHKYLIWGTGEYGVNNKIISPTLKLKTSIDEEKENLLLVHVNMDYWGETSNAHDKIIIYNEEGVELTRYLGKTDKTFVVSAKSIKVKLRANNKGNARGAIVEVSNYNTENDSDEIKE